MRRSSLHAVLLGVSVLAGGAPALAEDAPAPAAPAHGTPTPAPAPSPAAAVVAAVGDAARANAKAGAAALSGDDLGDLYVRAAAGASGGDVKAFLVGLADALDPTGSLRRVPVVQDAVRGLETPEAEKARRAVMGKPTIRGRDDWLLHWSISAALVVTVGERAAGLAGLAKEASDMRGPSGFSFADLLADRAGIAFARWLSDPAGADRLRSVGKGFVGARFLPEAGDLEDGLTAAEFAKRYGNVADERFLAREKEIRDRVAKAAKAWE
jgi:hypothetical protein